MSGKTLLYGDLHDAMQMNAMPLAELSLARMTTVDLSIPLGPAAVALVAIALAALLRRLRVTGAALVAGLAVGTLLGPGVLGRVAPDFMVQLLDGDPAKLHELVTLERERAAMNIALGAPSAAGADASAAIAELDGKIERARGDWNQAREARRAPMHAAIIGLGALILLMSGGATCVRAPIRRHQRSEAILVAVWTSSAAIALTWIVMWLWGFPPLGPVSLGAAAATSCGAWCLTRSDRRIAGSVSWGAAALIEQSARMANAIALVLLVAAMLATVEVRMFALSCAALACLPLGWLVRAKAGPLVETVVLPALTAMCMMTVEPFRDISVGLTVVLYLLLEDGRWLGAWLAHWTTGRAGPLGAMRLALVGMTVEPLIIAFTAVGLASKAFPSWLVGSLLLAATAIALLSKVRTAAAGKLALLEADRSRPE